MSSPNNSSNHGSPSKHWRPSREFERAREKEFYRYYQPFCRTYAKQQPQPRGHDGSSSEPSSPPTPYSSWDLALGAFAQLGALRLNARRCVISFFDRRHQYVLGEATRTLSLQTHTASDPEDALWRGAGIFPRGNSVCEHTTELPIVAEEIAVNGSDTVIVINDLSKHETYMNKPFVAGEPHARFHAGVPIKSPKGFHIGAYCVLDDKPRNGVDNAELVFLKDMARTIMAHLEMVRVQAEHQRSQYMIRGLGSFIEGNSSLDDWWLSVSNRKTTRRGSLMLPESVQQPRERSSQRPQHPGSAVSWAASPASERPAINAAPSALLSEESSVSQGEPQEESSVTESPSSDSDDKGIAGEDRSQSAKESDMSQEDTLSASIRKTFGRAVTIIREAIDVDGAVFLDASINSYGGLVAQPSEKSARSGESVGNETVTSVRTHPEDSLDKESSSEESEHTESGEDRREEKDCAILGCSSTGNSNLGASGNADRHLPIKEKLLLSLLQNYPNGKIWNFDGPEDGADESENVQLSQHSISSTKRRKISKRSQINRRGERIRQREAIKRMFPGVRSLVLVGLWDSHREKWFAASMVWSLSPLRYFTLENELSYLAAFGDSIMAEVARLDARVAEKAKSDFISLISHELRSPLHGILGSVECLQDTVVDAFQENLIHTVETCGKTLLDTIDHLLDFAKINNFIKRATGRGKITRGRRDLFMVGPPSEIHDLRSGMMSLDGDVDLSVISEEVIETVFAGYDYLYQATENTQAGISKFTSSKVFVENAHDSTNRGPNVRNMGKNQHGVALILDFDKAQDSHWVFQTQAGAWRRIILNLIGNSLKYTKTGFIRVQLRAVPLPTKKKGGRSKVTLTVTDSGKGISSGFMRDHLFRPFSQEDPHSPGTGLGLSITQQIVSAMGGKVDIDSKEGGGTEVTISLHMIHAPLSQESLEQAVISSAAERCHGMHLDYLDYDVQLSPPSLDPRAPENSHYLFMQSFLTICRDWFGIEANAVADLDKKRADIFAITEHGGLLLEEKDKQQGEGKQPPEKYPGVKLDSDAKKPLLVLCNAASSAHSLREARVFGQAFDVAEYIAQPFGPRKMAKALELCLDRMSGANNRKSSRVEEVQDTKESDPQVQAGEGALQPSPPTEKSDSGSADPPLTHPQDDTMHIGPKKVSRDWEESERTDPGKDSRQAPVQPSQESEENNDRNQSTQSSTASQDSGKMRASPTSTATAKHKLDVLLVDDNRINLQLLVTYMKKNGHDYTCAMNGLEAVEAYKTAASSREKTEPQAMNSIAGAPPPRRAFDFVLMDISMPVMDGLEATRQIRAHERSNGLRPSNIIALTGLASATAQQEAFSSGVDLFLTKPVKLKELTSIFGGKPHSGEKREE